MIYNNGNVYEGEWKNDKRNGQGKIIYKNCDIYEGEWKDDKLLNIIYHLSTSLNKIITNCYVVNEISVGYGIIEYPDESVYDGDIYDNEPNGFGKMISKDGDVKIGIWEKSILTDSKICLPQCNICMVYKDVSDFSVPCDKCNKRICKTCYDNHYKEIKKGDIIGKSIVSCPFCREISFHTEIDESLKNLIINEKTNKIGKCKFCLEYEKIEESCNEDNITANFPEGFVCQECIIPNAIKRCPGCNVYIEKNGGCNHMICLKCSFDFCWICLQNWNTHNINLCR